jgi:hypothetical protein
MDGIEQFFIENLKEKHDLVLTEYSKSVRQNSNWVTQVITVSGTILGGLILTQNLHNLLEIIGLIFLFVTINAGLFLMYYSNKKLSERLIESFATLTDYTTMFLRLKELSTKLNLSDNEKTEITKLQKKLLKMLKEMGIVGTANINSEFKLGSVYKTYLKSKSIDWGNYILIVSFFISGVLIIISRL